MNGTNGTRALTARQQANFDRVNYGNGMPAIQWTPEEVRVIKQVTANDLTDPEFVVFAEVCRATGLNPMQRQIYGYKIGGKMVIQTGIDGLRLIASRTGEYEGQTAPQWCGEDGVWVEAWLKKEPPAAAKVGVWRRGAREATYATVTWAEFGPNDRNANVNWKSRPAHMLAKTAEAHALRKAFPNETAGIDSARDLENPGEGAPPPVVIDAHARELYAGGDDDDFVAPITNEQMRRLHGLGKERGFEHTALSEWAKAAYTVNSVRELTYEQAEHFIATVEAQPIKGEPR